MVSHLTLYVHLVKVIVTVPLQWCLVEENVMVVCVNSVSNVMSEVPWLLSPTLQRHPPNVGTTRGLPYPTCSAVDCHWTKQQ